MPITIDLTPTEEAQLVRVAKQEGMEPEALAKKLVTMHLPQSAEATFAEILAPVHAYSQEQGYTEEEIGAFVDAEVAAYRAERRARQKAQAGE
jgi:hypothetical protein